MNYTKGEWKIEPHRLPYGSTRIIICAPDFDNRVAVISLEGAPKGDHDVEMANANLINAAPTMYEAIKALMKSYEGSALVFTVEQLAAWAAIGKAIKLAEGDQNGIGN